MKKQNDLNIVKHKIIDKHIELKELLKNTHSESKEQLLSKQIFRLRRKLIKLTHFKKYEPKIFI